MRHGAYSYLALGRMPKGCSYIYQLVGGLRKQLEDAVVNKQGELNIYHAAVVQTACRLEGRAQLLSRWLKQKGDGMNDGTRLQYLRDITLASEARDRALKQLGLDRAEQTDLIDALYSAPSRDNPENPPKTPGNGRQRAGAGKTPSAPETPESGAICGLCDGDGFVGRPCPECGKESEEDDE